MNIMNRVSQLIDLARVFLCLLQSAFHKAHSLLQILPLVALLRQFVLKLLHNCRIHLWATVRFVVVRWAWCWCLFLLLELSTQLCLLLRFINVFVLVQLLRLGVLLDFLLLSVIHLEHLLIDLFKALKVLLTQVWVGLARGWDFTQQFLNFHATGIPSVASGGHYWGPCRCHDWFERLLRFLVLVVWHWQVDVWGSLALCSSKVTTDQWSCNGATWVVDGCAALGASMLAVLQRGCFQTLCLRLESTSNLGCSILVLIEPVLLMRWPIENTLNS